MLRIGVVGLGVISKKHIEAIQRLEFAELAAVCDIDPSKKNKVPGVPFFEDLEDMLQTKELDCLNICLPHDLHVPAILLAKRYGVNVFVEKPIGLNTEDIANLQDISGIKVGVCLQNRYNPTTLKLKEIIAGKKYGGFKGCKAVVTWNRGPDYYSKDPWRGSISRAGGGTMLSQAIHTIDLMYLFGGRPSWVKGLAGNLLREEIEVEDTACAHIGFDNGGSGIFYSSVTHCFNSFIEFEVVFEEAVMTIQDGRLILFQGTDQKVLAEDMSSGDETFYYGTSHKAAIEAFYQAIINDTDDYISIEEGSWSVKICESVMESSRTGERVYLN